MDRTQDREFHRLHQEEMRTDRFEADLASRMWTSQEEAKDEETMGYLSLASAAMYAE